MLSSLNIFFHHDIMLLMNLRVERNHNSHDFLKTFKQIQFS